MVSGIDRVLGAAFFIGGASLASYGHSLEAANLMGDVGPGFFPGLLGLLMAGLGALLAFVGGGGKRSPLSWSRMLLPTGLAGIAIAYAALFGSFGFSLPSFLFLTSAMLLLGKRTARAAATYLVGSALFAAVLGWLLVRLLHVPLTGVWFIN